MFYVMLNICRGSKKCWETGLFHGHIHSPTSSLQVPGCEARGADWYHLQPSDQDGCQQRRCHQDLAFQQHEAVERQLGDQDGGKLSYL